MFEYTTALNYGRYNISLARELGLREAIYVEELINQIFLNKSNPKDIYRYTVIDRETIYNRTTITKDEQYEIDNTLEEKGIIVISKENRDNLRVILPAITNSNIISVQEQPKPRKRRNKTQSKEEKKVQIIEKVQHAVKTTIPEIRTAWYEWIDSVYEHYGRISISTVKLAENEVEEFSKGDKEISLALINWSAAKQYNDIQIAINNYKETHPNYVNKTNTTIAERIEVKLSNKVY